MVLKLVYNECEALLNELLSVRDKYDFTLEAYDSRYLTERKKGYKVKGAFSARLDPFVGVYDDEGKPIKGFYSEANECNINNIIKYLEK